MESLLEAIETEIFQFVSKISPVFFLIGVVPSLFRFVLGLLTEGGCSDSEETQKETTPKKEIETPVEIKVVNKARTIPRRCLYCYGILDNVDCCPYCGTVF